MFCWDSAPRQPVWLANLFRRLRGLDQLKQKMPCDHLNPVISIGIRITGLSCKPPTGEAHNASLEDVCQP